MEIYGFEKLGSHHQLLIWDRKDSGRYHHKIPLSNCFSSLSFCLMPNFPMIGNQSEMGGERREESAGGALSGHCDFT